MGNLEMVQALFKRGCVINAQGGEQNITPLHWAAHTEREGVALYLIQRGANVLTKDNEGRTPLSMATPQLAAKMKGRGKFFSLHSLISLSLSLSLPLSNCTDSLSKCV